MNIFDFVQQRRKELGLTQKQLADKAGFSISVVRRFEAEKPYDPLLTQVFRMAAALEVDDQILIDCY